LCVAASPDLARGPEAGTPPEDLSASAPPDFAGAPPDFAGTPPDLASAALAYGDVCTSDGQCASNVCSRNPFQAADHECTGPCVGAGSCMIGDACIAALGLCAQSDIGHSCNVANQGADCREGLCFGGGAAPGFCTGYCNSAADCPAGYSCSPTMAGAGGARICVAVDLTHVCATDQDCWYGTLCEPNAGRCVADCRTDLDCPLRHTCMSYGALSACIPAYSTGGGGTGAPCQTADDCRSGYCDATVGCVTPCGVTKSVGQYCTGGWGCNPIPAGAGMGYVLGCLPAGARSPGAACTTNTDCVSGLCLGTPSFCSRFCNDAPCPSIVPQCSAVGIVADGVVLEACAK
jgi:hypothetical protein